MAVNLALRFPIPSGYAYTITGLFGVDPTGYSKIWPGLCGHNGLDIACASGTPVLACHSGKVTLGNEGSGGYGKWIVVASGALSTRYAHLSSQDVAAGAMVAAGQQIGKVGDTGTSTGPHLHLEMMIAGTRNPCYLNRIDPCIGLLAGGVVI
jgi:murein DD-endopeptidase MepM/ murein hydrolase activator NlpD